MPAMSGAEVLHQKRDEKGFSCATVAFNGKETEISGLCGREKLIEKGYHLLPISKAIEWIAIRIIDVVMRTDIIHCLTALLCHTTIDG